jgi:hypothetical protein
MRVSDAPIPPLQPSDVKERRVCDRTSVFVDSSSGTDEMTSTILTAEFFCGQ